MSQNHRNSNPIYPIGAIAGIISAIVTVLTYLEIKPSSLILSFDNVPPENVSSEDIPPEDIPPPISNQPSENLPPENVPPPISN